MRHQSWCDNTPTCMYVCCSTFKVFHGVILPAILIARFELAVWCESNWWKTTYIFVKVNSPPVEGLFTTQKRFWKSKINVNSPQVRSLKHYSEMLTDSRSTPVLWGDCRTLCLRVLKLCVNDVFYAILIWWASGHKGWMHKVGFTGHLHPHINNNDNDNGAIQR